MRTPVIYYGAAYYDEYMPVSRIDTDMQLMKDAGMNVIRIGESTWSTWEPQDGVFDFTRLHNMLRGAEKHGISVIVGTPTYAIPPWLVRKYPDILADTHAGPGRYGHRQNMDITHPGYRFHCERIIRRMMEVAAEYGNVIGFQLDNETKPYDTCGSRAQELFRQWLKDKFGTVEAMNAAWGLAYWSNSVHDWKDLPDVRGTINGSMAAEFEAFQRSLVTEFHAWQRAIVDEYRKPHQFVTHNYDFAWEPFHCAGLQPDAEQFASAEFMTVAGCDIYHPSGKDLTGLEISFGGDLARGLKQGQNYLVLETQAQGPLCNFPYPGQLRLQAFSHLASGANLIEYWHWHSIHTAIESHWKGVLSHDLTPGATYREVQSIGLDLQRIGSRLKNLKRKSSVAIVVSNRSLTAMKHDASFSDLTYNDELLRRTYRMLFLRNIPCDIISDETRDFSAYKLVVTPCLYSAARPLIDALRQYVENGGHLLSTYRSFFTDEHAAIRPAAQPFGMTDVFGMTYDQFCPGDGVPGVEGWMELLQPQTAQVLRGYDHPAFQEYAAVTWNAWGKGSAGYIGAKLSDPELENTMDRLLPRLGIALPEIRWPLIRKQGINDFGKTVTYLFNHSAQPVTAAVPHKATELLTEVAYAPQDPLKIPGWGVAVLEEL